MNTVLWVLLPIVACSLEKAENADLLAKRGLDHRSNLALLNNLNFETSTPVVDITPVPSPTPSLVNVVNPAEATIPVTINTENLALGNPNPIQSALQFTYAPTYPQNLPPVSNPLDNIFYYTGERVQSPAIQYVNVLPPGLTLGNAPTVNYQNEAVANVQDNRNILQTYVPQNVVEVPQPYPIQLIREVKVPQPYPVHITRTIQVPVQVRVPVEVPKPYAVRVPHPVPVPVHIKVPVPVEKPYPVQITKTVAVPVEKPVYIKVPQPIRVPVPQPYPVGVPQPVQIQVPFVVRLPETSGQNTVPNLEPVPAQNFDGASTPLVPNLESGSVPLVPNFGALFPVPPQLDPIGDPKPSTPLVPFVSTTSTPISNSSVPSIVGNGLLPPRPPKSTTKLKTGEGLLKSYVSSKEGGVYRRATEYQTNEYKKTW